MISVYYGAKGTDSARLVNYALMHSFGIADAALSKTELGKPYLKDHPHIHVSITHTAGLCAVAVSDSPVGIDAESPAVFRPRVAKGLFTASEREYARDGDSFCRIWMMKESFAKMTGEGITRKIAEIDVITGENTGGAVFTCIELSGITAYVCSRRDSEITVYTVPSENLN